MTQIGVLESFDARSLSRPRLAPVPSPAAPPLAEVLLLEDDQDVGRILKIVLQASGYAVTLCGSLSIARDWMTSDSFDMYLVDLLVPDGSGYELIDEIKTAHPNSHVVVISGDLGLQSSQRCLALGASECVEKPFSMTDLVERMDRLIGRKS